eukprot:2251471-Prymnesium_polylepis.1
MPHMLLTGVLGLRGYPTRARVWARLDAVNCECYTVNPGGLDVLHPDHAPRRRAKPTRTSP